MHNLTPLPSTNFKTMPWANGLGSTTEIFKQLAPTTDKFLWRVSLADVPASGPFSLFDGYERLIAVATGAGMSLSVAGAEPVTLRAGDGAFRFSGAAATDCELLDGAIRDFNLIYDPEFVRGEVVVLSDQSRAGYKGSADQTVLVFVFEGSAEVAGQVVEAGQAVMVEGNAVTVELCAGLTFVVIVAAV
jgi:uncharacterized protein